MSIQVFAFASCRRWLVVCATIWAVFGCSPERHSASEALTRPGYVEAVDAQSAPAVIERKNAGQFRIMWRGADLTTGGGGYVIASCTGEDKQATNILSIAGSGVMETERGSPAECGNPPYTLTASGTNPVTLHWKVGPLPHSFGVVSFTVDLDRGMNRFAFASTEDWHEGCADDFQPRAYVPLAEVSSIRSPCLIEGIHPVGVARRALTAEVSGTLHGRLAKVTSTFKFLHSQVAAVEKQFAVYNHPGASALGIDFNGVETGQTIEFEYEIGVRDADLKRPTRCGEMSNNEGLMRGEHLDSCDGKTRLSHQTDGNLVVQRLPSLTAVWQSGTSGQRTSTLVMQNDGNLVLYDLGDGSHWNTSTEGNPGAALRVQDDGNVVISAENQSFWQSGTMVKRPRRCGQMSSGESLPRGEYMDSCDGKTRLSHQTDGNIVIQRVPEKLAVWQSGTLGKNTTTLVMQSDGNLVLYGLGNRVHWHTTTVGNSGATLHIQNDGNVVIDYSNQAIWQSGTMR